MSEEFENPGALKERGNMAKTTSIKAVGLEEDGGDENHDHNNDAFLHSKRE